MSEEEKKRVLSEGFGSRLNHSGLDFAVPLWWVFRDNDNNRGLRNGSAFLVDYGHGVFAVTAAHVFTEYRDTKHTMPEALCQLGSVLFDPESRLIGCRDDLDIATFRVEPSEAQQTGKSIVKPDPPVWEPLNPADGNFAFFCRLSCPEPGHDA